MAPTSPPLRTARASSPAYGSSGGGLSFALGKRFAVAKLRPRLLVASGRLIPSPEIQVSTGKELLIPRGRAGLEASYLLPISPPFNNKVDPMAARKGDLVLYSGDLFPTEARKLPSCPRSHSVNRKGKPTHLSAHRLPVVSYTSCILSHASYLLFLLKIAKWRSVDCHSLDERRPLILFSVCCSPNGILRDSSSSSPLPEEFHIERISTPDRAPKLLKDSAWKRDGILSAELKETSKLG
ncbi:UNVERIFIED_CONTAM: hypothetical protein Scaly_2983000 [Sesamum calycinum]|uniref:Uncharacterized protein n=1 Tax=Sesamum calycinum TaxID=2727403 RepID=A0AAW2KM78_9LAMI